MKNLISNTEFGDYLEGLGVSNSCYRMLRKNFDLFLKQLLEIWMFVPCDENGVIFEEPERVHFSTDFDYKAELSVYQEAKGRCLFNGFELIEMSNNLRVIIEPTESCQVFASIYGEPFYKCKQFETIEDLLEYDIELTLTTLKQIGL